MLIMGDPASPLAFIQELEEDQQPLVRKIPAPSYIELLRLSCTQVHNGYYGVE